MHVRSRSHTQKNEMFNKAQEANRIKSRRKISGKIFGGWYQTEYKRGYNAHVLEKNALFIPPYLIPWRSNSRKDIKLWHFSLLPSSSCRLQCLSRTWIRQNMQMISLLIASCSPFTLSAQITNFQAWSRVFFRCSHLQFGNVDALTVETRQQQGCCQDTWNICILFLRKGCLGERNMNLFLVCMTLARRLKLLMSWGRVKCVLNEFVNLLLILFANLSFFVE